MADVKPEDVKFIVVHCSKTTLRQGDSYATVERKCRMRGALSCGYHFVITRDGVVHNGRALHEAGNHLAGHNADSIAVCMVCTSGHATVKQRIAVKRLLEILQEQFPEAEPVTHEELDPIGGKGCPGYKLRRSHVDKIHLVGDFSKYGVSPRYVTRGNSRFQG